MSSLLDNLEQDYDRSYGDLRLVKRFSKFAKDHKRHLFLTILGIIVGTGFTLLIPFTLQEGVDQFILGNRSAVLWAAVLYLIFNAIAWFARYVQRYQNTKFTAKSTRDIRRKLFVDVQDHDMAFFDDNKTGKLMSRIMDDTEVLAKFVALVGNITTSLLIAFGTVFILFYIDVVLTLYALSVVPFLVIFILIFRKIARNLARDWRSSVSDLNDSFQENVAGIAVAKSFGRQERARTEFEKINQENFWINFKKSAFFSSIFPTVFAMSNVGLYLVLFNGGIKAVTTGSAITAGTIVLYVAFLRRFYFPILQITTFYQQLQAGLAAAERIFSLMDVETKVEDIGQDALDKSKVEGRVTFDNMTFRYNEDTTVYQNFNLTIEPGESIALVGHTGSGKSTLISLLLRFYEIDDGRILLDGKDIKDYKLSSYRSIVGMVLQDPLLFSGTIRSNIAYGVDDTTDEEVRAAAEAANLWEFIEQQPDGLDTMLHERGQRLSQGQKQLVSLARAFLVDPQILLLDEATASIDAYSEALIQEAIDRLLSDRTSITIAHRLTTVERVNRIVVLDHGEIIEQGSHDELLQKDGHYANLYEKYFEFQEVQV